MLISAISRWLMPNSRDFEGVQEIKRIISNSDLSDKEKGKALNILDRKAYASTTGRRWMIAAIAFDLFLLVMSICFMITGNFHLTTEEVMSALCWIIGITAIFVAIYIISDKQYKHEIMKYIDLPTEKHAERSKNASVSGKDGKNGIVRIKTKKAQSVSEPIRYICDSCESKVKYGMKYCPECGKKLDWPD